ncbi:DNA-binding protein [Sulfurimonas sp.]|uniref:DNA-binding protein n=1 Tax=Sulfurimonas sp. TaxID=2022749 RepID=UPI00356724F4
MEIKYENLEKIDELVLKVNQLLENTNPEKRWLNINEAAYYLGYSKDHLHKLKNDELIQGKHYYKKGKLLFDKYALDEWVTTYKSNDINTSEIVSDILEDIAC